MNKLRKISGSVFMIIALAAFSLTGGITASAAVPKVPLPKPIVKDLKLTYSYNSPVKFRISSLNYTRKVKYMVSLYDAGTKKSINLTKGYGKSMGGSKFLSFTITPRPSGKYIVKIYVKALASKASYNNYIQKVFTVDPDRRGVTAALNKAKGLLGSTVIGTRIGNISPEAVTALQNSINLAEQNNNSSADQKKVNAIIASLNGAIISFNNAIVKPADKTELIVLIKEAQQKANSTPTGEGDLTSGQVGRLDKYALINEITTAVDIVTDSTVTQAEADKAEAKLKAAMDIFVSRIEGAGITVTA